MPLLFVTHEIVCKVIASLNSQGASGPDGLPGAFYKHTVDVIVAPLAIIFNLSLQTGVIPDIWKKASITPVFKKGSPSDPANYRPISITCIACRLLEVVVRDGLLAHLRGCGIISSNQHGFLTRKSTTTQLLACCYDWNLGL